MRYYCNFCLRDIKEKGKYSHLKSKSHQEFEKYKHIILSLKRVDLKDVDEILYLYIYYNKKYNQYLLKGQFKLIFNNQDCKYLMTDMINNTTNISWSDYIREAIEGCDFSYIAEMDIIILVYKRDMTYGFYSKHNMSALERKINQLINKDKNLINEFPYGWKILLTQNLIVIEINKFICIINKYFYDTA